MVLSITKEEGNRGRGVVEESLVTRCLLDSIFDAEGRGSVKINKTTISDNSVAVVLSMPTKGIIPKISHRGPGVPHELSYVSPDDSSLHVNFSLPALAISIKFEKAVDFHRVVGDIFRGGERWNGSRSLEEVGLEAPEELQVDLVYTAPLFAWRALPSGMGKIVQGYKFGGNVVRLEYPLGVSRAYWRTSLLDDKRLGVGLINIPFDKEAEVYGLVRNLLSETGLVTHSWIIRPGQREEEVFSVDPAVIKKPKNIRALEEIARMQLPDSELVGDLGEAKIYFKGNVPRNLFVGIPALFDRDSYCGVEGEVSGAGITVKSTGNHLLKGNVSVFMDNSTLERADRLYRTRALAGCSFTLSVKESGSAGKLYTAKLCESA